MRTRTMVMMLVVFLITGIALLSYSQSNGMKFNNIVEVGKTIHGLYTQEVSSPSVIHSSVVKEAQKITKSECDTSVWDEWSNLSEQERENIAGLTKATQKGFSFKNTLNIKMYIDSSLVKERDIKFVAWHECGHGKTYNLPKDKVEKIYQEVLVNFSECKNYEEECLADSMAEYKTGNKHHNGYLRKPSTKAQLQTAEKVWNASGKVYRDNNKSDNGYWLEIAE